MNFGPSARCLAGGLSKTVGIRKDLIADGRQMGDGFHPLFTGIGPYADGVPQQDFPV
jgi:hypothetical protein